GGVGIGGGQGFTAGDDAFAKAKTDEPFAYGLAGSVNQNRLAINFVWVLVPGYLVMFMQAGFAMVETGFCRAKSAMHVMMTNFMVYGLGLLAFWVTGFALMFGRVGGAANLGPNIAVLNHEFTIGGWGFFGLKGFM